MSVELKAERSESAEESPIVFRITKALPFTADDAAQDFQAQVWCPHTDIARNADKLRAFHERIACGNIKDEVSVTFAVVQGHPPPRVHPGRCMLTLLATPSNRIIVSVQLTALQPGRNTPDLLDSCAIHFETDPICVEDFFRQLDRSSSHSPSQASLRGFDLSD
jgi:hypothetical protein